MNSKVLLLVAFILAASNVFAFDRFVEMNSPSTIVLQDGDVITLSKLPSDWNFSRVALGVNSVSPNKLTGRFVVRNCAYRLNGYYKLVDFGIENGVSARYYGPTQQIQIQGWVDSAPVQAKCENVENLLKQDSSWQSEKDRMKFLFAVKTAKYKDLGPVESMTNFEGPSGLFKITSLPEWNFNRIYVQVEPMDGRELDGYLYSRSQQSKVAGWSANIPLILKTDFPVVFELAFPEFRKVRLKWWAVKDSPKEEPVKLVAKDMGDSVEAVYTFENSTHHNRNVALRFRKDDFVNGKIPTVKKLEFNPNGVFRVDSLKSYVSPGDVYDINAELANPEPVTFALPLDFKYNPEKDSLVMMHQENDKWATVPVDSVVNGFAYFKTTRFSPWSWLYGEGKNVACSAGGPFSYLVSETCRDAAGDFTQPVRDFKSATDFFYEKLKDMGTDAVCLDKDGFKRLFEDEKTDEWIGVPAGHLDFNSIWPGNDPGFLEIYNILISRMNDVPQNLEDACKNSDDKEVCEWRTTRDNLDILLAEVIIAQRADGLKPKGFARKYKQAYYDTNKKQFLLKNNAGNAIVFKDYFKTISPFVERSGWFVKGLRDCLGFVNADGIAVQKWIDFTISFKNYTSVCQAFFKAADLAGTAEEVADNGFSCAQFSLQNVWREYGSGEMMDKKDDKLIAISEVMDRVSLLAWLDKTVFRDFLHLAYQRAYDGLHEWLELADPFLISNNIVAKASASLSLYEYIFTGGATKMNLLNESLKKHYGEHGGYSEGMGYSQYIWDDVPYVLGALKDAYASNGEKLKIEEKFLKSPDFIFEFSRPVGKSKDASYYGFIPVEIDDGCTYNPDYRVWAKLKNDSRYLAMSEYAPLRDAEKKNVLVAFGFPNLVKYAEQQVNKIQIPKRGKLWGSNKDGLLMITAVHGDSSDADTVALSMVAEKGDLWENGQAHDQQDNLSITLAGNKSGFIIQDRGYTGFGERTQKKFHRYSNHNVVIPKGYDQPDNERISGSEIRKRVQAFAKNFSGGTQTGLSYLYLLFEGLFSKEKDYSIAVVGGAEASVGEHFIDSPEKGVVGYTATTHLYGSNPTKIENHRSILYFGGSFWVIDRANTTDLTWLANSPIVKWTDINNAGLHLYGSSEIDSSKVAVETIQIDQKVARNDYWDKEKNTKDLTLNSYSVRDKNTNTFVMTYAVDSVFAKVTENCPTSCKCFENSTKDKRIIIPPLNEKFELCDAVPKNECTDNGKSSAITMLVKSSNKEWISNLDLILDGELTTEENGSDVKLKSVKLSRRTFLYEKLNGSAVSRKHNSIYLPANIILLRQ